MQAWSRGGRPTCHAHCRLCLRCIPVHCEQPVSTKSLPWLLISKFTSLVYHFRKFLQNLSCFEWKSLIILVKNSLNGSKRRYPKRLAPENRCFTVLYFATGCITVRFLFLASKSWSALLFMCLSLSSVTYTSALKCGGGEFLPCRVNGPAMMHLWALRINRADRSRQWRLTRRISLCINGINACRVQIYRVHCIRNFYLQKQKVLRYIFEFFSRTTASDFWINIPINQSNGTRIAGKSIINWIAIGYIYIIYVL